MADTVLFRRENTLVRRLHLAAGEATPWHRDPYHRLTLIVRGGVLAIEYGDSRAPERVATTAGQVDWDEPCDQLHRAVNVGDQTYEEITVFFLDHPDAPPQPGR
jgi:quercetin dioxygenase-like cupin family protein